MRFLCPSARTLFLMLLVLVWPSAVSASAADATRSARRVQIQCTVLRARISDVDAFGINFDLILPKPYLSASAASLGYAETARGAIVAEMLNELTYSKYSTFSSVFAAPTLETNDGQCGAISLANMTDFGMTRASQLTVIPHVQTDGTIRLFVSPQFKFASIPGTKDDPPATSISGFPVTVTVQDKNLMVLRELPWPTQRPFHPSTPDLPFVISRSGRVRNINTTELLVFMTVTVLSETSATTSFGEPMHHA